MWIFRVIDCLNKNNVKYAIAGGYAVALHGAVRGTVDLDLVIVITEANLKLIEEALNSLGLQSRIPVKATDIFKFRKEYIEKRNLIAWSFVNFRDPSQVVDIVITHDLKVMKVKKISVSGHSVNILDIQSLIQMKKDAGRPQDIEDIKILKDIYENKKS